MGSTGVPPAAPGTEYTYTVRTKGRLLNAIAALPLTVTRVKGRALSIYWSTGEEGLRWARMFHSVR